MDPCFYRDDIQKPFSNRFSLTGPRSSQYPRHQLSMYIRQAVPPALVLERQALVVDAEQVHQGGLEVVDVDGVLDDVVTEFVGFAIDGAGLDAGAGHPDGEAAGVVVAAVVVAE